MRSLGSRISQRFSRPILFQALGRLQAARNSIDLGHGQLNHPSLLCISSPCGLLLNLVTWRGRLALEPLRKVAVLLPFSSCAQDPGPSRCDDGPRSQASRLAGSESLPNSFVTALSLSRCPSRWMERYLCFLSLVKRGRKEEDGGGNALCFGRGKAGGRHIRTSIRPSDSERASFGAAALSHDCSLCI